MSPELEGSYCDLEWTQRTGNVVVAITHDEDGDESGVLLLFQADIPEFNE